MHRIFAALAISFSLAACAGGGATYAPPPEVGTGAEALAPAESRRTRPRSDRLTEAEVDAARSSGRAGNAHVLVHQLRPRWLAGERGPETFDTGGRSMTVQVWYNGRQLGAADVVLAGIPISNVISMRYLNPIDARATYGPGNGRGAIVITGR